MKKLLVAALGLGIALGSVSFAAQTDTSADSGAKKTKKHKKGKKGNSSDTSSTNKM
jgi:hypothetical protein